MLTKNDLEQIRGVVRDEVKAEVSSQIHGVKSDIGVIKKEVATFRTEVNTQIESVKTDVGTQIDSVKADVKMQIDSVKADVKMQIDSVKADVKMQIDSVKSDVKTRIAASEKRLGRKIRNVQNSLIQYHDEYAIYLRERIEKLEEHTGLVKSSKN